MADIVLYGTPLSTYVRTARLVLEEKGQPYQLVDVNIFQGDQNTPDHQQRHPFGKVPVLEHGDFRLFETMAIVRYLDAVLDGPGLIPADSRQNAIAEQWMSAVDSYIYPTMIGALVWQRTVQPMLNQSPDEDLIAQITPEVARQLDLLGGVLGNQAFFQGDNLTALDLYLAPIMGYVHGTPEGRSLMDQRPALSRWWQTMDERPSYKTVKAV